MELIWIFIYLILGSAVGFLAGLLGVGGGALMVPILTTFFVWQGFAFEHVVHMALATSMAAIVVTSFSSLRAHHKHGAVLWPVVWQFSPGIIVGTFSAALLAALVPARVLAVFFVVFMAYVALHMFLNRQPQPGRHLPGAFWLALTGLGIGSLSALVAIGGGSMTVPFLTWCNVSIRKAIATSAAVGFPISIAGTIGYFVGGAYVEALPDYTLGYVYLPAAVPIATISFIFAPLGARLAHRLPVENLKKIFSGVLLVLCMKMLHTVFSA